MGKQTEIDPAIGAIRETEIIQARPIEPYLTLEQGQQLIEEIGRLRAEVDQLSAFIAYRVADEPAALRIVGNVGEQARLVHVCIGRTRQLVKDWQAQHPRARVRR